MNDRGILMGENVVGRKNIRVDNCAFVKIILMLFVVIGHCVNFWNGTWFTVVKPTRTVPSLEIISDFVNSFHIYGFTLVSGFLFGYLKLEKGKYADFWSFVGKKVKRLLVPYVFVCLVWVAPITELFFQYDMKDLVDKYVLAINPSQLWFLLMLFWVYIISWAISGWYATHYVISGLLVFFLYCFGIVANYYYPNVWCIWIGCEYVIFFWIGFQLYIHEEFLIKIKWYVWMCAFLLLFIVEEIVPPVVFLNTEMNLGLHVLGAIAIFETIQHIAYLIDWENARVWILLGKRAMPMYLFHQQVIYFTIYLLNGVINPYLNALVNFIVSIGVSIIISSILMKFKITRFLIGEK